MNDTSRQEFPPHLIEQFKQNWRWYLVLGIGLVIGGTLAVIYAFTTTLLSVIYFGMLLIIRGFFELIKSLKLHPWTNFLLHLVLGIAYCLIGGFVVSDPLNNAASLTLVLAVFFVIAGAAKTFIALTRAVPHQLWLALNGISTFILGILIWKQWPSSSLWAIGMLIGIDTIFTGWTWIMLSLAAKQMIDQQERHE